MGSFWTPMVTSDVKKTNLSDVAMTDSVFWDYWGIKKKSTKLQACTAHLHPSGNAGSPLVIIAPTL